MSALVLLALCAGGPLLAQAPPDDDPERAAYIRANYSKFEYQIPMRDGAKLFACAYVPNELGDKTWPILLLRTPYNVGPYGLDRYKDKLGPSADFEKEKFIFVFEDVRGRYMSEGDYVNMRPHTLAVAVALKRGPRTSTKAPTLTTPSTGW